MSRDRASGRRRAALSLAVILGPDRGKILRTGRSRVVVGADPSVDLVLTDPGVAPRHLVIELDGADFRWEAGPERKNVLVDRSWVHPESGQSGGRVQIGMSSILVFAGELTDAMVSRELRASSEVERADEGAATDVGKRPAGLDPLLDVPGSTHDGQTMALSSLAAAGMDAIALAAQPTQARPDAPRILADQHTRILGASEIRRAAAPPSPREIVPEVEAIVEPETVRGPPKKNAWGDSPSPSTGAEEHALVPTTNRWGDAPKSEGAALIPAAPPRNAWDKARVAAAPSEAPRPSESARARVPRAANPDGGLPHHEIVPALLLAKSREPALQLLTEPDGAYATQVRLLGTRLGELFREFGYRAFMMTSAEPLTGKTTAAVNLALALAEDRNRRVALIEVNFRFPKVGEILSLPPELGLIGLLEGRLDVQEASARLRDRNLVVFPAGGRHPQPGELLTSPRLKTLVRDLLNTVDVAIIDAPSVKPSADTNLVLGLVDGALLVALDGETTSRLADQAIEQLGRERVLGGLYNRTPPEVTRNLRAERRLRA